MAEKKLSPLKAIRAKCLECSGTWYEVKLCPVEKCALHPYRFGKNPYRPKREYTEEELAAIRARLAKARATRDGSVSDLEVEEMEEILDAVDADSDVG